MRELSEGGISHFISNIQNGFAKFFNTKESRHGSVFTNPFKATWIESDEQLAHTSRYVHLNHVTSYLKTLEEATSSLDSSLPYYVSDEHTPIRLMKGNENYGPFLNTKTILDLFGSRSKYLIFIADQIDYQRSLNKLKKLIPEEQRKFRRVRS